MILMYPGLEDILVSLEKFGRYPAINFRAHKFLFRFIQFGPKTLKIEKFPEILIFIGRNHARIRCN